MPRPWRAAIIEDGKTTITWNLPRLLLPKNRVKLLLNMLVIAQQTIPRGGMLTIDPIGEGETMSFRVTATGLNARLPQNIAELLSGGSRPGRRCACGAALLYAAVGAGLRPERRLAPEGEAMIVTAS